MKWWLRGVALALYIAASLLLDVSHVAWWRGVMGFFALMIGIDCQDSAEERAGRQRDERKAL